MLTLVDAQKVADKINLEMGVEARRFVMHHADLSEEKFAEVALKHHLDRRSAIEAALSARGEKIGEIDVLWLNGYWKALWRDYRTIRASGGAVAGRA